MTEQLELAKFFESDRVPEMDVGCGWVDSEFDTQRSAEFEFFQEFFFREDFGGSGGKL